MKQLTAKTFAYRNHMVRVIEQSGSYYLVWCAKSNQSYHRRGQHISRVLSREDLARNLKAIRWSVTSSWRVRKARAHCKREQQRPAFRIHTASGRCSTLLGDMIKPTSNTTRSPAWAKCQSNTAQFPAHAKRIVLCLACQCHNLTTLLDQSEPQ